LFGKLTDPSGEGFWLFPQTTEQRYEVIRYGKIYTVYERVYALFPQKAGQLILNTPKFFGQQLGAIFASRRGLSPFENHNIRIVKPAKKINVKTKPTTAPKTWLPASKVILQEQWSNDNETLKVGEPIERTINLQAKGLSLRQLPQFQWQQLNGLKIYPGKEITNEHFDGQHVISQRQQTITYIPTDSGEINLPEIRLPWFNINNNQLEIAKLKQQSLKIRAVTNANLVSPSTEKNSVTPSNNNATTQITTHPPNTSDLSKQTANVTNFSKNITLTIDKTWLWFGLILIVGMSVIIVFWSNRKVQTDSASTMQKNNTLEDVTVNNHIGLIDIKKACLQKNPHVARQLIHQWLETNANLTSAASVTALQQWLKQLDGMLYSDKQTNAKNWDGKSFWREFKRRLK